MHPRNYMHVMWDDYMNQWRCWIFQEGRVVEREHLADIATVVARAQELRLPVDIGERQGRLRVALQEAGVRLLT